MERLPYIDEHAAPVHASRERVWTALSEVLRGELQSGGGVARVLGCDPVRGSKEFVGAVGQSLPGFRVVDADPGRRLTLEGRHRFSRYRLTFVIESDRLRAQTHAAFPGLAGRLYRLAVIGSGAHRLVTRRLVRQVAVRA